MKHNFKFAKVLFILFFPLIILACGIGSFGATATPVPTNTSTATNTPQPTNTATPKPTLTPRPTITLVPTPAAIGEAVRSDSYEVTVIEAKEIRRVYMGNYYYYPQVGQSYVEALMKISNLTGSKTNVPWQDIYLVEESGDSWYPIWGGYKAVSAGKKIDGSTIGVNQIVDGKATLDFEEDVFVRMIWYITKKDKTTILFGFSDSPLVKFTIK